MKNWELWNSKLFFWRFMIHVTIISMVINNETKPLFEINKISYTEDNFIKKIHVSIFQVAKTWS